jgi:hypothetical protein
MVLYTKTDDLGSCLNKSKNIQILIILKVKKIKLEDGKGLEPNPFPFSPSYASFTARLKYDDYGRIKIFAVKTKKAPIFNWGFSGGKEESIDDKDFLKTSNREYTEETTMEDLNKSKLYFSVSRKDNLIKLYEKPFINYFLLSFQDIEPIAKPKLSPKESVEGIAWFSLKEYEDLPLKQSHRLAFVELCYYLKENFGHDQNILEDLLKCSYQIFERPSEVGNVLMWKHENGTSLFSKNSIGYFLSNNLSDGLKIEENPKG